MPKPIIPHERNALASGPDSAATTLRLKGRIWLEKNGKTFLSWGRVVLLERIAQEGSLAAAARSMGMSYSHAWNLVQEMNCLAESPMVEKQAGGPSGGGATVTDRGHEAIRQFWRLVAEFQTWVDSRQVE